MKRGNGHRYKFIDERGTSLVELIVIMAILAILLGVSGNVLGYLNGKEAQQCAYKIEAAVSEIRMETMSRSTGEKDSVYLKIQVKDGKIVALRKLREEEKYDNIGKGVTVVAKEIGGSEITLTEGSEACVYFQRSTGALYEDAENICQWKVSQGKNSYVVKIEPTTGKISYERE